MSSETTTAGGARPLSDEHDVREATDAQQHDFPYGRGEEAQVTRREFCNFLGLTSAAFFVSAAAFAAKSAADAAGVEQYEPRLVEGAKTLAPGTSLNFAYPGPKDSAILVRALDGRYFAYGQKCSHLSCPVYFEREHGRFECPCHEGAFALDSGQVLYGPPPRPLDVVELEVRDDGEVWAVARRRPNEQSA
jgi:Rieske Fe-S protein